MDMNRIIQFLFFALILQVGFAAGSWKKAGDLPVPVYGAKAVIYNNKICVIGGYSSLQDTALATIQMFDPGKNIWTETSDSLFAPRYGLNAHVYSDSLFIFGGVFDGSILTFGLEKHSFVYDPVVYSYNYNFNRIYAASVIYQSNLYIFGGYPDFDLIEIDSPLQYLAKYNIPNKEVDDSCLVNNNFRDHDYLPNQQMAVLIGDSIYLFGGEFNGITLDEISQYNINLDTLITVANLNRERTGGAAVALDKDNILIIAGKDGEDRTLRETEIYQISSNMCYNGPPLLRSRGEVTAIIWADTIFVFGGVDNEGNALSSIEKISVQEIKTYTVGPTETKAINQDLEPPAAIRLYNAPNPFNASTHIRFNLDNTSRVQLIVYSVTGQVVKTLENGILVPGEHDYTWNGFNDLRQAVPSGIYFCRLQAGIASAVHKLILLK